MKARPLPTQEQIKKALDYNPQTGIFTWKQRGDVPPEWNARWAGKKTGSQKKGHYLIRLNYVHYHAHHLAWVYMTGKSPSEEIDHRDTDGLNNKWENLREATPTQNRCNRGTQKNNKSGYKGVSWHKKAQKWVVYICINKKSYNLGLFENIQDAHAAYKAAALKYHGEFARAA